MGRISIHRHVGWSTYTGFCAVVMKQGFQWEPTGIMNCLGMPGVVEFKAL